MSHNENIVSFYRESKKRNIVLTDEYLETLGDEFQQKDKHPFEQMTFEQWVDYHLWKFSTSRTNKKSRKNR